MKNLTILLPGILLLLLSETGFSQKDPKSTQDLSFLIGEWEVTRTYRPESTERRVAKGRLSCDWALDNEFIACEYKIPRPGKQDIFDRVYFNYNSIYNYYESLWLSATWPVKVLMEISVANKSPLTLDSKAEFSIGKDTMEYVKGQLKLSDDNTGFKRTTYIRTSKEPADQWLYHMLEEAVRIR